MTSNLTWLIIVFLLIVRLAGPSRAWAQTTIEEADGLFRSQNWEAAAKAYTSLTHEAPENGQAWYRLGVAQYQLKRYETAATAWTQADKAGFAPVRTRYNLASAFARLNRNDEALGWLEKAVNAGFNQVQTLKNDDDLTGLHDDPRFEKAVLATDMNARPCAFDDTMKQFDFWIGSWDVFNPEGGKAGTNMIEKAQRDCLLIEHWIGANGGTGTSYNFYDSAAKKWKQTWVDSGGNNARFEGTFTDGAMRMSGQWVNYEGTTSRMTMDYTPLEDGRVRQFIRQSLDDGKTWSVWFDGYYTLSKR